MNYLIQLPNDVRSVGYKETAAYKFEQVFSSKSANFTGTEADFVKAGHGYFYTQGDAFTRYEVPA